MQVGSRESLIQSARQQSGMTNTRVALWIAPQLSSCDARPQINRPVDPLPLPPLPPPATTSASTFHPRRATNPSQIPRRHVEQVEMQDVAFCPKCQALSFTSYVIAVVVVGRTSGRGGSKVAALVVLAVVGIVWRGGVAGYAGWRGACQSHVQSYTRQSTVEQRLTHMTGPCLNCTMADHRLPRQHLVRK